MLVFWPSCHLAARTLGLPADICWHLLTSTGSLLFCLLGSHKMKQRSRCCLSRSSPPWLCWSVSVAIMYELYLYMNSCKTTKCNSLNMRFVKLYRLSLIMLTRLVLSHSFQLHFYDMEVQAGMARLGNILGHLGLVNIVASDTALAQF